MEDQTDQEMSEVHTANKRNPWWVLLKYVIRGNERRFTIAVVTSVLSNAFVTGFGPLSVKYIFDEGIIRGDFWLFVLLSSATAVVFTLWRIWVYYNRLYIQKLKVETSKQACARLISKYYEIPYREVLYKDTGYFVSRVYDEASSTCQPTVDTFILLSSNIATLIVAVAVVLSMSWRASFTVIISIPLIYLVARVYGKKVKYLSKEEKEKEALLKGVITRSVNSFKLVNIFNLKASVLTKIGVHYDGYASASVSRFRNVARYETLNGTLMSYTEIIATIGAGYEILVGRMTFGAFMGFMQSFWGVIGSIRGFFSLFPEISRLVGSVERLIEFEEITCERPNLIESDFVRLNQVSFSYDQRAILGNVSFTLISGERILVVGPNGSGKSTLIHLIAGVLSPSFGKVNTFPLSRISAIIYPSEFIPGSIADNMSFLSSGSERHRFDEICVRFGLHTEIDKDPIELSAGQRKRLEIMMGLVKEADIYIFDEPLAGIDIESKEVIMNEIFRFTKDKILIVVMHGDEQFHGGFDRRIDLNSREPSVIVIEGSAQMEV